MAIRKNRPVLYEVVGLSRRQRDPNWKERSATAPPETPAAPPPKPASPPPRPIGMTSHTPGPLAREAYGPSRMGRIRFVNGRLLAELYWPGLAIAGFVLLVLLLIAFDVGRRTGRSKEPTPTPAVTEAPGRSSESVSPPGPGVSPLSEHRSGDRTKVATPPQPPAEPRKETPPAADTSKDKPEPAPAFEFKSGYHYLVVQHFRKSQEDAALTALRFLRDHGIDGIVRRGADLQLCTKEAFDLDQKDANARNAEKRRMEELKNKIRALGKEYSKEHGYAFEQIYEKAFK